MTAVGTGGISGAAITTGSVGVTKGGTGLTTWAANGVPVATATDTVAISVIPSCSNATTSKLLYNSSTQTFTCGTDQTSGAGTGITDLNGLTGAVQTFVNDTNVTMVSSGTTHTLTWASTLAVARGGTGAGTLTGLLLGNGTSAVTALTTSAGISGAISDETGSGALVFGTAPTVVGGSFTALTALSVLNSGTGTFSLRLVEDDTLTANRNLTFTVQDASRTISLGGNLNFASAFTTTTAAITLAATGGGSSVTVPATGTLATLAGSETLTNKTLTSPVLNVGSDATGDIYYRNAGVLTRLGVGSAGQVLTVASGVPSWAAAGAASYPVATLVSANYTVLTTDWLVSMDATAGARTVTLYTAVGNSGKIVEVCKSAQDTSANVVTVAATASYSLSTPGECVRVISNNTSWGLH